MAGFFAPSSHLQVRKRLPTVPQCGACGLFKHCQSPKMRTSGRGQRRILLLAEAPGSSEDRDGVQLIGPAGECLEQTLAKVGVTMRRDCWLDNALICFPQESPGKHRTPTDEEIEYCRPNILHTIREKQPDIIIPLGGVAVKSLLGHLWKEDTGPIGRWIGWRIPCQALNAWIAPCFHPSYIARNRNSKRPDPAVDLIFEQHLRAAVELEGKPWPKGPPNYQDQVVITFDIRMAAFNIRQLTKMGLPVAIDFENTPLKPDRSDARIISCAVSNGEGTIAYPWDGDAIEATKELLRSDVPKIASNMKHEIRWALARLGIPPINWVLDTMVAAHVLDGRQNVSGLKFQAFARLGAEPYDDHIKPFLQSGGANTHNRIREIDLKELLTYNALDALLEVELAKVQDRDLGMGIFP